MVIPMSSLLGKKDKVFVFVSNKNNWNDDNGSRST